MLPNSRTDLTGKTFSSLFVLGFAGQCASGHAYNVRCDCGCEKVVSAAHLRSGHTRSCGCINRKNPARRVHGETGANGKRAVTPEYRCWVNIRTRCNNPNIPGYVNYGGRGIKVCSRWENGDGHKTGFECFLEDMGRRPSPAHSIDRFPDNDGNYEPGNCRWATRSQQACNRRPQQPYFRNGAMVHPKQSEE